MNAPVTINFKNVDWSGCDHWLKEMPYRALVPIKLHSASGPMLYQVAGSADSPCGAERALRAAMKIHGGKCFYCSTSFKATATDWTLDHVEAEVLGGTSHLANLVIACKPCNTKKGHQPIDSFDPNASRLWLEALSKQIDERLSRLEKKLHS